MSSLLSLQYFVSICSSAEHFQKPSTFPSSTCIDLLRVMHVCYIVQQQLACSQSIHQDQTFRNYHIYYHVKHSQSCHYRNVIYYSDVKADFLADITPVFSVTWSFRNHSDILIFCSRNISYYYQCNAKNPAQAH